MKRFRFPVFFAALASLALAQGKPGNARAGNTVILDANAVANLRLETAVAEPRDFEETVFALGRVEPRPGAVAAVSSRIPGRVAGLAVRPGDLVAAGSELVRVESRQAGDPPPVVALPAPLAGTVTSLEVRLGDPVEPDHALLEITDLSEVEAVARVPEHASGRLRPGTVARIRFAAWPEESFAGELVRLGASADPATGTLAAHFRLANPDGRLRPGLRAEFSIVVAKRTDVLAVPRAAVQGEGGDRFVFARDFELLNAFLRSPVVIGAANDQFIEIVSGLFPGDEVATRGAYSLAFAGGGSLSLKEALDAAHGHEHAEDGSELPAHGGKPAPPTAGAAAHDGADADSSRASPARPWQIATGMLALACLVLALRSSRAARKET